MGVCTIVAIQTELLLVLALDLGVLRQPALGQKSLRSRLRVRGRGVVGVKTATVRSAVGLGRGLLRKEGRRRRLRWGM